MEWRVNSFCSIHLSPSHAPSTVSSILSGTSHLLVWSEPQVHFIHFFFLLLSSFPSFSSSISLSPSLPSISPWILPFLCTPFFFIPSLFSPYFFPGHTYQTPTMWRSLCLGVVEKKTKSTVYLPVLWLPCPTLLEKVRDAFREIMTLKNSWSSIGWQGGHAYCQHRQQQKCKNWDKKHHIHPSTPSFLCATIFWAPIIWLTVL